MRSNVISSQEAHARFGGVVPEIASRHHLELVNVVIDEALARAEATLDDVELVAATQGPGLVGALLVGLSSAKALAAARELSFAAVDHLQGHVAANFLLDAGEGLSAPFEPPFVCLIASGGHTLLALVTEHSGFEIIGTTLDDAAGEAFDKGARMLGLGYPGGAALERLAADGDTEGFAFPGSPAERSRGTVAAPAASASPTASTSHSRASRPRCSTRSVTSAMTWRARARPTSPPPIRRRSSRRSPCAPSRHSRGPA